MERITRAPGIGVGTEIMQLKKPGDSVPLGPLDWFKLLPFEATASSDRLGWVGLEAARYRAVPASELSPPAMSHHRLALFVRPPEELEMQYDEVKRHVSPPAGSISLVPAGTPLQWRSGRGGDMLQIYLDPELMGRVVAEEFDLDPGRLTVPPLDALDLPHLRAAMWAVDAELAFGGPGGGLAGESLANVLTLHLIRHVLALPQPAPSRDGTLPRAKLRAVMEYIEGHLDASPTLEHMAAIARLSVYHFARQFRRATGLPPHQYVIMRRVEKARQLLQAATDLSLAEVALHAGFSGQSVFCHHFKRLVGVTPRQFRMSARIA
jgi:AraC family transcriptional regulator